MKLTDDMLKNAASEAAHYMDKKCADNGKNQSHTFSPWFEREMEELIQKQKRRETKHKVLRYGITSSAFWSTSTRGCSNAALHRSSD